MKAKKLQTSSLLKDKAIQTNRILGPKSPGWSLIKRISSFRADRKNRLRSACIHALQTMFFSLKF